MQIEVRDGSRTLWVEEFGCFLENGELAFSYYELPDIVPPAWIRSPEGSQLHEERKSKDPEHPDEVLRSMQSDASDVVSLYATCIEEGGLSRVDSPVVNHALEMTSLSRLSPGFYAEKDDYRLSLEAYQHKSTTFWRVKYGAKLPPSFRSKREPPYLLFLGEKDGRVTLRNPESGDKLWAPSGALDEDEPRHAQDPKFDVPENIPILWSILPEWIQLVIEPGTEITASRSHAGGALAGFSRMSIKQDLHAALETCLNRLDSFGFDSERASHPNHSYFLRPMTGGRHVEVRIKADSGDTAALTFVHTLQELILYAYYSTPRPLEEFLRG